MIDQRELLETIEGATIVSAGLDTEGEGLHINLSDGRVLVFIGVFTLGLFRLDNERLH